MGWTYYMENCYYLNQTGTTWESARAGNVLLITSPIIYNVKSLICRAHIKTLLCNLICIFVHNFFSTNFVTETVHFLYVDHVMHITLEHFYFFFCHLIYTLTYTEQVFSLYHISI